MNANRYLDARLLNTIVVKSEWAGSYDDCM